MKRERTGSVTKSIVWGLFLIALGVAFLLERSGVITESVIGEFWPVVFYVIAITHVTERRPGSALTFAIMGTWFFAVNWGWFGFTYHNSWPVLLVAVGAGLVVKALSREGYGGIDVVAERVRRRGAKEEGHE
jgi:hypothetical protein